MKLIDVLNNEDYKSGKSRIYYRPSKFTKTRILELIKNVPINIADNIKICFYKSGYDDDKIGINNWTIKEIRKIFGRNYSKWAPIGLDHRFDETYWEYTNYYPNKKYSNRTKILFEKEKLSISFNTIFITYVCP